MRGDPAGESHHPLDGLRANLSEWKGGEREEGKEGLRGAGHCESIPLVFLLQKGTLPLQPALASYPPTITQTRPHT